jgi:hypothetical protein
LKQKLEQQGVAVFPNLEFRLANSNNDNDLCDYHVIFDCNLKVETIDNFLANLDVHVGTTKKKISILTEEECKSNSIYVDVVDLHNVLFEKASGVKDYVLC